MWSAPWRAQRTGRQQGFGVGARWVGRTKSNPLACDPLRTEERQEGCGDAIVVVGIDRLGRTAAEVMTTIRDLGGRGIVLRSLREGIDTSNATGRMVAGVLASLAELELELGRERRSAAREARRARGQSLGRPKALNDSKAALAQRMHAAGESATTLATTLGVSRATIYRVLADESTVAE